MKFFKKMKDGGAESTVTGYWLVEIKSLFSIVLLKFEGRSREAFHEHAFNCISWVIRGQLLEAFMAGTKNENSKIRVGELVSHEVSIVPFVTKRSDFHKVSSLDGTSWVLSFRGPWAQTWREYLPNENRYRTLTHGRKEISD